MIQLNGYNQNSGENRTQHWLLLIGCVAPKTWEIITKIADLTADQARETA